MGQGDANWSDFRLENRTFGEIDSFFGEKYRLLRSTTQKTQK